MLRMLPYVTHICIHKMGMCSKSDFKKVHKIFDVGICDGEVVKQCVLLTYVQCSIACPPFTSTVTTCWEIHSFYILHNTFFFIVSTLYFLEKRLIFRYGPCTVSTQKSKLQIEHINQKSSCRNCRCLVKFLYLYPRFRCNIYLGKSEYLD